MTVIHLTQSASGRGGGIPEVLRALTRACAAQGGTQITAAFEDSGEPLGHWSDGSPVLLPAPALRAIPWSRSMTRFLSERSPDLVHTHGLWTGASAAATRWGRRQARPWIVSPHGMLEPWALARSRLKKRVAAHLFENSHLREARCLHALCEAEAESMRAYGLTNPIAVIPNGVDLPSPDPLQNDSAQTASILLFLGRVHPKKGLANTLQAWAMALGQANRAPARARWLFVIAGWDQDGHAAELKTRCDAAGLAWSDTPVRDLLPALRQRVPPGESVVFTGPVFGAEKDALLRAAQAFILPSFSEGLPMSVLEAWAYGLPVLMTDHCHLPQGFESGAATRIETDPHSIATALRQLTSTTPAELAARGELGRQLVAARFTWRRIATDMLAVYDWARNAAEAPACLQGAPR